MTERGPDGESVEAATPTPPAEPSGEGSVSVLGTAHVSQQSVDEVESTIERERPDVVAVELDESRYRRMQGETPEEIDAKDVIKGKTIYQFIAYWLLSYIQTRLGDRFDIEPGADMRAAIDTAEEFDLGVALVDRDIQLTVQRFWKRMRLREKAKMFGSMAILLGDPLGVGLGIGLFVGLIAALLGGAIGGPFFVPASLGAGLGIPLAGLLSGFAVSLVDGLMVATLVTAVVGLPVAALLTALAGTAPEEEELDIDDLTDGDVVTAMIEEFRHFSPGGAQALIDERDAFIAHRLIALRDAGYSVVAVVGAGHRQGIESYLAHPETLPSAESLVGMPSSGRVSRILYKGFGYLFTVGFLVFFILLAMAGVRQQYLLVLFGAWFLVNGIIAAGLAKLAGAHWPSALTGGAVAWLTSVNPLLAPGWFAGYVELRYLDVSVGDIGELNELLSDEESPLLDIVRRMREVPLFRLILVVGMTNVGSFIASILFATVLLPQLSAEVGGVTGLADQMVIGARRSLELIVEVLT
jgi:pheromone shutdown protein TraB